MFCFLFYLTVNNLVIGCTSICHQPAVHQILFCLRHCGDLFKDKVGVAHKLRPQGRHRPIQEQAGPAPPTWFEPCHSISPWANLWSQVMMARVASSILWSDTPGATFYPVGARQSVRPWGWEGGWLEGPRRAQSRQGGLIKGNRKKWVRRGFSEIDWNWSMGLDPLGLMSNSVHERTGVQLFVVFRSKLPSRAAF